jgi:hypothetical protein
MLLRLGPLSRLISRVRTKCMKRNERLKGPVWSSECFVFQITQQMSFKFAIWSRNWKLFDRHNSDPYRFDMNPTVLKQSSCWKAYSRSAAAEISCHLWKPKVHYRRAWCCWYHTAQQVSTCVAGLGVNVRCSQQGCPNMRARCDPIHIFITIIIIIIVIISNVPVIIIIVIYIFVCSRIIF